jgi:hypothetical protein
VYQIKGKSSRGQPILSWRIENKEQRETPVSILLLATKEIGKGQRFMSTTPYFLYGGSGEPRNS